MWPLLKVFQISATFRVENSDGRWVMLTMSDAADTQVSGGDGVVMRDVSGDTWRVMMTDGVIVGVLVRPGQCAVRKVVLT